MTDAPDALTDEERQLLESLVATSLPAGKARWGAIIAKYDRLLAERDEWQAKAELAKPELAKQTLIEASRQIHEVLQESGEWQRRTVEAVRALEWARRYHRKDADDHEVECETCAFFRDTDWAKAILKEETQ